MTRRARCLVEPFARQVPKWIDNAFRCLGNGQFFKSNSGLSVWKIPHCLVSVCASYSPVHRWFTTLFPEVFLELRESRDAAKTSREAAKKRKTSGYIGLESHCHADARIQPQARIGWYFYKHASQYDWFVWLVIPRGRVIAKLPLVTFEIINLTRLTAGVCMKVIFKSRVTSGFFFLAASRLKKNL